VTTKKVFYGQFTTGGNGATGLTVTINISSVNRSTGATASVVSGGSATHLAGGVYYYRLTTADLTTYDYVATFVTTGTADLLTVPALWTLYDEDTRSSLVLDSGVVVGNSGVSNACHTSLTHATDSFRDMIFVIVSGTRIESAPISSFNNTNGAIVLGEGLSTPPVDGDLVYILASHVHTVSSITQDVWGNSNNDRALTALGVAGIWAALSSGLTTVGSIGKRIVDFLTGDAFAIVNNGTYGNAALLTAAQNIQNNTFIATSIPMTLERPDTGSATINISIVFSDETGTAKNLDSGNPIITLVNDAGTDLSSRLGSVTNPATGKYVVPYTNTSTDAIDGLHWDVSGTINGKLRRMPAYTQIVDTTAVDFTSADRTKLNTVFTKLPINNIADQTLLPAATAAAWQALTLPNGKDYSEAMEFIVAMVGAAKTNGAMTSGPQTYVVRNLTDTADLASITNDGVGNRSIVTW
jgi:hypothetical protein